MFVFILTGCGQKSSDSSDDKGDSKNDKAMIENSLVDKSASSNKEAKNVFTEITGVELPDSPALKTEGEIRSLLEKIFGDLKATSYSNDVYGAGSLLVEYTAARLPVGKDLGSVTKALKGKGYTATIEHVDSNIGTAMYDGKEYTIAVTFDTSRPTVGVSYIAK